MSINTSLAEALLPTSVLGEFRSNTSSLGKKNKCALALLVVNVASGAIAALRRSDYKAFDAIPGDGGCQMRALELRRLISLDLTAECDTLETKVQAEKALFKANDPELLLRTAIHVSKEMEYFLLCYLSQTTRTVYKKTPNGVPLNRSDISCLAKLSKQIDTVDIAFRRKILEMNQLKIAALSIDATYRSAQQINGADQLLVTMLSSEHQRQFTDDPKYTPKTFACQFYTVKAMLLRLKEELGIVCVKQILPANTPFHIFCQSKVAGGEFEVLEEDAVNAIPANAGIVVIEAMMNVEKELASSKMTEQGFTNVVLSQAAAIPPYDPKSTLANVQSPAAVQEITSYRELGGTIGDFFIVHHIYLSNFSKLAKV